METTKIKVQLKHRPKAHIDTNLCVACDVCARNCPVKAIVMNNGINAEVNYDKCVGCSKCSNLCPASIIEMK